MKLITRLAVLCGGLAVWLFASAQEPTTRIRGTIVSPGSFIGTAARKDLNGRLIAQEVVVFPEAERGTGEGHYAWDLGPSSTMTNANVDAVVSGTQGRDLHLSFKGGSNVVTVPTTVPIVKFIPAARADLLPGKLVFVVARNGDSATHFAGVRIVVEKDGVKPPM